MIGQLKKRFILLSLIALFVLLSLVVVGMNVANYVSLVRESDELLALLSMHKGHFPGEETEPREPYSGRLPPHFSPETPHETRYFTVFEAQDGTVLVDISKTVTVDEPTARLFARRAREHERSSGFVDGFRYSVTEDLGGVRYVFLDCGRKLDDLRAYIYVSTGCALLGYLLISMIVVAVAGRIVRPVAESYEKQKRFITDAGHELKTPLTILRANVDLLAMEKGEDEYLEEIRAQTERMSDLTARLVFSAKLEETGEQMASIPFSLSDAATEETASFAAPARLRGLTLVTQIEPMLSYRGNEEHIRTLVSILLDNAVKYAKADTEIVFSLKKTGRSVHLYVSNLTERPLSAVPLEHLFDRFYRPDDARTSSVGGHGLGLSIARAIVSSCGGKIAAHLTGDERLCIQVTLPIKNKGEYIE